MTLTDKHFATERFPRLFRLLGELGKPSICAANGHVLAGALGIALACDLIIAREGARFGTPEINVGVFPFMIMALIYRNVPRKRVNEMLLLGEQISTEEAERIGIVNRVVGDDEFDQVVREWAGKLAAKSPVMMRLGKDAMFRQLDMPLLEALDFLRSQLTPTLPVGLCSSSDRMICVMRSSSACAESLASEDDAGLSRTAWSRCCSFRSAVRLSSAANGA